MKSDKSNDVAIVKLMTIALIEMITIMEHWDIPPAMKQVFTFTRSNLKFILTDEKSWKKVTIKVNFDLDGLSKQFLEALLRMFQTGREINGYRTTCGWKKLDWIKLVTKKDKEEQHAKTQLPPLPAISNTGDGNPVQSGD